MGLFEKVSQQDQSMASIASVLADTLRCCSGQERIWRNRPGKKCRKNSIVVCVCVHRDADTLRCCSGQERIWRNRPGKKCRKNSIVVCVCVHRDAFARCQIPTCIEAKDIHEHVQSKSSEAETCFKLLCGFHSQGGPR